MLTATLYFTPGGLDSFTTNFGLNIIRCASNRGWATRTFLPLVTCCTAEKPQERVGDYWRSEGHCPSCGAFNRAAGIAAPLGILEPQLMTLAALSLDPLRASLAVGEILTRIDSALAAPVTAAFVTRLQLSV